MTIRELSEKVREYMRRKQFIFAEYYLHFDPQADSLRPIDYSWLMPSSKTVYAELLDMSLDGQYDGKKIEQVTDKQKNLKRVAFHEIEDLLLYTVEAIEVIEKIKIKTI